MLGNLLGRDVENGELPNDEALLGTMIRNICYANARAYLSLPDLLAKRPSKKPSLSGN